MATVSDTGLATQWSVRYDRDVVETLKELSAASAELYENALTTLEKIERNPLVGAAKTGELRGFRADHIEHLVVVWELVAEGSETPITNRAHLGDIDEVYVHGIEHHDEMVETVKGSRDPVPVQRAFRVRFNRHDIRDVISRLYNIGGVDVREEVWDDDGVEVRGTVKEEAFECVTNVVPETAELALQSRRLHGYPVGDT